MSGSGISWAICKSAPRSRQTTTPAPHHSVFTGHMPFLSPNQQRQSTEGNVVLTLYYNKKRWRNKKKFFKNTKKHYKNKNVEHIISCMILTVGLCLFGWYSEYLCVNAASHTLGSMLHRSSWRSSIYMHLTSSTVIWSRKISWSIRKATLKCVVLL